MSKAHAEVCPTCLRKRNPLDIIRVCFKCGLTVTKHHKWRWIQIEAMIKGKKRLICTIQHWDCKKPDAYRV